MSYEFSERREARRVSSIIVECYSIVNPQIKEFSFARNISTKGFSFLSFIPFKEEDVISYKLYLSNDKEFMEGKGKIVWRKISDFLSSATNKLYEFGVEFVDISDDDRDKIYKYVLHNI